MPKPVLTLKREEAAVQEQKELVLPMNETPTATPQPTSPQQYEPHSAEIQAKFGTLLELIRTLNDEQIKKFFTREAAEYFIEEFAKRGDPIAKLARAHFLNK